MENKKDSGISFFEKYLTKTSHMKSGSRTMKIQYFS